MSVEETSGGGVIVPIRFVGADGTEGVLASSADLVPAFDASEVLGQDERAVAFALALATAPSARGDVIALAVLLRNEIEPARARAPASGRAQANPRTEPAAYHARVSRRSDFEALTRRMDLASVAVPADGVLRRGTLTLAPSGSDLANSVSGARRIEGHAPVEGSVSGSRPSGRASATPGSPESLPRLDVAEDGRREGAELELGALLGAGGMGAVYVARQRSLQREVAVKRLKDGPDRTQGVGALLAEARIAGALEHPSIVPVHALGLGADGSPLLVMKRIEGASLEELLKDDAHPAWTELVRRHGDRLGAGCEVLMRVAEALHFAHTRGVVHRDVKPANVMVGSFGEVYLLDWGVALEKNAPVGEETGEIVGTPAFMAPEMVEAADARIDARTDVYLLGATLHAVLTGSPRHYGDVLPAILLTAYLSDPFAYGSDVPTELAELANRATSASPDARPPTSLAFRDALAAFLRHRGATRLAAVAEEKLDALRPAPGERPSPEKLATPEVAAALAEARFGLTEALREWEGDERTLRALREAMLWTVDAEIFRKSPDGALTVARALDPEEPGLLARIEALRAELAESERLAEAARREEAERDGKATSKFRLPVLVVTLVLTVFLFGRAILDEAHRARPIEMTRVVPSDFWMLGIMATGILVFRKRALANRAGRQLSALFLLSLGSATVADAIHASRGETSAEAGPMSVLLIGAVYLGASIGMGGRLWWAAIVCYVAGIIGAIWPATATSMVGVGCLGCLGALIYDALGPPPKPDF